MSENTFFLEPVPPFRLDLTVWALRRHPDNAVDRWDGKTYRRVVPLSGLPVELAVEQVSPPEAPRLCATVRGLSLNSTSRLRQPGSLTGYWDYGSTFGIFTASPRAIPACSV